MGVSTTGKKRALFIGPLPPPVTGQSLACAVLLEALRSRFDVEVIDINKSDLNSGRVSWSRIADMLGVARRVRSAQRNADLVYFTITESLLGNLKDMLIYAACLPRLERLVIHLHGGAGMVRLLQGRVLRLLNGWFLRRMGAVIVLGSRLAPIYKGLVLPERLKQVQNFAEDRFFLTDAEINAKHADHNKVRLLYLSNMIPEKGCLLIADALEALPADDRAQMQVDFAGAFPTPEAEATFRARIASLTGVAYHGTVHGDAKRQLLADAHIVCLPTYYPYEGQPICILEGYAAGCAVVTTDHSGILDVFTDGENGLLVEKRSVESLARALLELLTNRDELTRFGKTNAAYARRQFSVDRYNTDLLRILDTVVA